MKRDFWFQLVFTWHLVIILLGEDKYFVSVEGPLEEKPVQILDFSVHPFRRI